MKKLITLFALVLTLAGTTLAQADVCVTTTYAAPYHRVYAPVRYERRFVPGRGWVVYGPAHRVLVWNRYHRCWM
jgi:hypothetical protein